MTATPKSFAASFFADLDPSMGKATSVTRPAQGPATQARNEAHRKQSFLDRARDGSRHVIIPAADRLVRPGLPAACRQCRRLTTSGGACPGITAAADPVCGDEAFVSAIDAATLQALSVAAG